MWVAEIYVSDGWPVPAEGIGTLLWVTVGTAVGEAARNRRAFIAAIQDRAQRAEQTREEEAQRRVIQERLRIARELHDVVAHHIAVINVQAGAVSHLLTRRPEAIAPAVLHIREACDTVLTELGSIVGVLRQPGDPASTEPAPGLERLPDLLQSMAGVDHEVATAISGDPRKLPSVTDLAAYRIIQEALTNAHKYGTGRTDLEIRYRNSTIEIRVSNLRAAHTPGAGSGYGLLGMSERVAAAAGTLHTELTGEGRFVVQVSMPTPPITRTAPEPA
nr:histidine kinase [Kineosporia babensis]